ncbi:chaperone protein dnaJ 49-like [Salvia divinorum]|uniref:Chaperone protein dnaJ 49-like n=1 Tax=Salvia divinorum TaxID=28513 RepID=A0ABD1GVB5_SALDI
MDGNKDEALKCLNIAKNSIQSGDRDRAVKFLKKARRLDPSIQIDEFLSNLSDSPPEEKSPNSPTDESPPDPSKTAPRRRVPPTARSTSSSSTASATYTEEQVTIVRDIKRKKDYYEILGVEKSCTGEDVRKAYRKLSLKVHPDKNTAPGAEEAFKMVSKAFQCLSDDESRKKYDVVGSDEPVYERRGGGGGHGMRGFNGFYEADVDADEIFRNFFFGGMHPATTGNFGGFAFGPGVRVRTGGVGVDHSPNWVRTVVQLLPVILILLVNFMPSSEPVYSLSRTHYHDVRFTTPKGVNYFANSGKFEQQVEWQQLHWGYRRETPNCDALRRFEAMAQ